ncbi:vesicle transport protein USE1 [Biomphalaria glabrata]|uniref:Vesicle transport protein USE1 n=1 Tax=Biomphalaria glabrata TaxID=6526 RepID=A0A2C9KEN4_BIOGL|nr:vesicle transport protein USE1-like isoform X1 [Biomphalaria glabrata]KAI8755779.1 vesicle transport protein USE1-like [Biomphalaria glabrata]KAI8793303.1 vesicle transport protein USE1 [Biomphalaria glabrata]
MAAVTRIEINFNRLLRQCELMAEDKEHRDWRFEKYIAALQNFLVDLKKTQSKPPQETILEYQKKVDLLKGLSEAEKQPCAAERSLITERLRPVGTSVTSAPSRQLQAKAKATCEKDLRSELLGPSFKTQTAPDDGFHIDDDSGLRMRKKPQEEDDINVILQHHHKVQERLAEEMLMHTRALRQNVTDAGRVVREDTKIITDSTVLADNNMSKLKLESERLEAHTKTCSWWIWLMLLIVVITFISMVLFMRIFSK